MRSPASCAVDEAGEVLISLRQRSLFLAGVALKIRNVLPPTRKMGLSETEISSIFLDAGKTEAWHIKEKVAVCVASGKKNEERVFAGKADSRASKLFTA